MTADQINETEPKTVIMLWNYLNWGGAQIYLLSIVKHAPKNWKFKIVVPRESPKDILELFKRHGAEVEFQDVSPFNYPAQTIQQKLKRQWRRIRAEFVTYKYISRQNLENTVLHIETAPWQSWILIKKLAAKTNVFVTMHNSFPVASKFREIIFRFRLKQLSKIKTFHIFTSNRDTKNSLKGWVTDEFWNRIKVTYTCVDPPEIDAVLQSNVGKEGLRNKFSVDLNKFVVLCVGQFIDRKGRKIFLETAQKLLETGENVQFLWLTQSEIDDKDKKLIESFQLKDAFRIVKSETVGTDRADILNFFKIADAFALPSYVEGLPIALLEAMALKIPSISTNVNAIPEAIINNQTGILIEAGNADELVAAIKRLVEDLNLRNNLSERGRNFVIENFDERVCAKIALDAYTAAINNDKNKTVSINE